MEGILFLSVDDVITIHHNQIINYGGTFGVRNIALLQNEACVEFQAKGVPLLEQFLLDLSQKPCRGTKTEPLCWNLNLFLFGKCPVG